MKIRRKIPVLVQDLDQNHIMKEKANFLKVTLIKNLINIIITQKYIQIITKFLKKPIQESLGIITKKVKVMKNNIKTIKINMIIAVVKIPAYI